MYTQKRMNEIQIPDICKGSAECLIEEQNWDGYTCGDVLCKATLSHDETDLLVLFEVAEPEIKADCTDFNQRVCNDSCVELFLQNPQMGEEYVNFEFSASGYCLAGRGKGRENRVLYPAGLLSELEIKVSRTDEGWRLYACIPLEKFALAVQNQSMPLVLRGNLYKCGDGLAHPHYLSWTGIESPAPDFHRPEFFGSMTLL